MDSTVVAVFEDPSRAEEAKRELLARDVVADKDVSVVRQRSVVMKKGPIQRIKGLFGATPPMRERAVLTVYVGAAAVRQVERIIRQHDPSDVQTHLSSSTSEASTTVTT